MRLGEKFCILGLGGALIFLASGMAGAFNKNASPFHPEPLSPKSTRKPSAQTDLAQPYRFAAMGDWGAGTPFQKAVAAELSKQYQEQPFDALVMLGDNIYPDGNIHKYGKAYFTDMYADLIKNQVNFIVALGNHDALLGHDRDQVAYFKMPGYYYDVKKPHLHLFIINSNTFHKDHVQQQWLKKALSTAKEPWLIVAGHHPIYSSGDHGLNPELKKTLEPILEQNHVDFYLAGHDHDYERFAPIHGVQYIVSGGGGAYLRGFPHPLPQSLVREKTHHFLRFQLNDTQLEMTTIDSKGNTIDHLEVSKAVTHQQALPQAQ